MSCEDYMDYRMRTPPLRDYWRRYFLENSTLVIDDWIDSCLIDYHRDIAYSQLSETIYIGKELAWKEFRAAVNGYSTSSSLVAGDILNLDKPLPRLEDSNKMDLVDSILERTLKNAEKLIIDQRVFRKKSLDLNFFLNVKGVFLEDYEPVLKDLASIPVQEHIILKELEPSHSEQPDEIIRILKELYLKKRAAIPFFNTPCGKGVIIAITVLFTGLLAILYAPLLNVVKEWFHNLIGFVPPVE